MHLDLTRYGLIPLLTFINVNIIGKNFLSSRQNPATRASPLSQLHSTPGSHVQGWFGRTDLTKMRSPIFVYSLNINREIQTKIRDGNWFSICFSVDFMLAKIKLGILHYWSQDIIKNDYGIIKECVYFGE